MTTKPLPREMKSFIATWRGIIRRTPEELLNRDDESRILMHGVAITLGNVADARALQREVIAACERVARDSRGQDRRDALELRDAFRALPITGKKG